MKKPYPCPECPKMFPSKQALGAHRSWAHISPEALAIRKAAASKARRKSLKRTEAVAALRPPPLHVGLQRAAKSTPELAYCPRCGLHLEPVQVALAFNVHEEN